MSSFIKSRFESIFHAVEGWWYVLRTQKNAWIHAVASIGAITAGLLLKISLRDWAVLFLAIAIVWSAEFFNTALEAIVDLTSPEVNHLAKVSKDVGAAAVLIAAAAAILIGIFILGPPLWAVIQP